MALTALGLFAMLMLVIGACRRRIQLARIGDSGNRRGWRPDGTLERIAAANLNRTRRTALSEEFRDGALPTPAVQAALGLRTPQAVHRLRSRGKLVGAPIGNQTWFPAWQFDDDRIRPELPRILELLARFTGDAMTADRIMRITHDELAEIFGRQRASA